MNPSSAIRTVLTHTATATVAVLVAYAILLWPAYTADDSAATCARPWHRTFLADCLEFTDAERPWNIHQNEYMDRQRCDQAWLSICKGEE